MSDIPLTDEDMRLAVERLARTADGRILYLFLQRRLMAIAPAASGGALRVDQGERMFAAKLIGLMAKGIQDSGRRTGSGTSTSGGSIGEQPIVFAVAGPRAVSNPGGSGRRVTRDTIVPGWNDTRDSGGDAD